MSQHWPRKRSTRPDTSRGSTSRGVDPRYVEPNNNVRHAPTDLLVPIPLLGPSPHHAPSEETQCHAANTATADDDAAASSNKNPSHRFRLRSPAGLHHRRSVRLTDVAPTALKESLLDGAASSPDRSQPARTAPTREQHLTSAAPARRPSRGSDQPLPASARNRRRKGKERRRRREDDLLPRGWCGGRQAGQASFMTEPSAQCPKRMVYGPCGGVRSDLTCEMGSFECPFVALRPAAWTPEPHNRAGRGVAAAMGVGGIKPGRERPDSLLSLAAHRPVVLSDFTVRPYDVRSIAAVTKALAGSCDAVLIGEHNNRPDFPPAVLMPMIRDLGLLSWTTLTCRDRNRVVLEQELAALAALAGEGVLCVTGDGRGVGVRPGVTSVFDLDGTRLAATAAGIGVKVAVAETPEAPPEVRRPYRLLQKQLAGAHVCFLNHVSSPDRLAQFVAEARAEGVTLPFVAGVAVYTDARSAAVLQAFPGLHLDSQAVAHVLRQPDPIRAGIDAAVAEARAVLAIPGVIGVNISGLASAAGELAAAKIKATVGREVLDR